MESICCCSGATAGWERGGRRVWCIGLVFYEHCGAQRENCVVPILSQANMQYFHLLNKRKNNCTLGRNKFMFFWDESMEGGHVWCVLLVYLHSVCVLSENECSYIWVFLHTQFTTAKYFLPPLLFSCFVSLRLFLPCHFLSLLLAHSLLTPSCFLSNPLLKLRLKEWCKLLISFSCLILSERVNLPAAPGSRESVFFFLYTRCKNKHHQICF